jgi:tripartite-type tricarboxylate transporter receptor subunit TctC
MKGIVFVFLFFLLGSSEVQAQVPFYQGKSIRIVVGFAPGGAVDVWARVVARYWPKYIPGNPDIIVQNMPGGGSMIAANYVYGVAKPDGLTLASIAPALYFDQLIGRKEVQFDWTKFTWIGSPDQIDELLFIRADAPYKTLEDIRKAAEVRGNRTCFRHLLFPQTSGGCVWAQVQYCDRISGRRRGRPGD